jgi:SPP1 family predicted phage head-tail adaptor
LQKTQTFNDGIIKIYEVTDTADNGKKPVEKLTLKNTLRFHERTVGITRFYSAMQANKKVDRVIRCQKLPTISTLDRAEIGGVYYTITQIQYPEDVEPPCMDLTLSLIKAV